MGMQKEFSKGLGSTSREKYISWTDENTEFMLEWFIQAHKDKPYVSKWKKQHHQQCAQALNEKFGLGVTRNQVNRHFRSYKEKWNWIRAALAKSGYGFDATVCKFDIDLSEKDPKKLGPTRYNYLTKPIKFFHLLEELFGESPKKADGSFAVDLSTVNNSNESDGDGSVKDLEQYVWTSGDDGNDSDTIPHNSPTTEGTSSGQKRKYWKSPSKKPSKDKGRHKKSSDDVLAASIIRLVDHLSSGNHPPPPAPPPDPNTILTRSHNYKEGQAGNSRISNQARAGIPSQLPSLCG